MNNSSIVIAVLSIIVSLFTPISKGLAVIINRALARHTPFEVARLSCLSTVLILIASLIINQILKHGIKKLLFRTSLRIARMFPSARAAIAKEQNKTVQQLEAMIVDADVAKEERYLTLPVSGLDSTKLLTKLGEWSEIETSRWRSGQASGTVYHGGKQLTDFENQVYSLFSLSNPLHPDIFPYIRKMEAEVVQMVASLFNGKLFNQLNTTEQVPVVDSVCGTMTSGGTESIIMAVKSYRDRARAEYGIEEPEMIAGVTVHAAFDKAAHFLGVKLVHVPIDINTGKLDLNAVRRNINSNTILIAGSAPGFPHGVMDDLESLSRMVADKPTIGIHTDCCLGSFLMPVIAAQPKKYPGIPIFDFRLPGIQSISCDPHKYGYAVKGSSVILYRNAELRKWQYFVTPDWTGGIYASPSMPGSRPGGLVAATWAAMLHIGRDGYISIADEIMNAAQKIRLAIENDIPDLRVIGNPCMSVVAFDSVKPNLNIYAIGEYMGKQHWSLNTLQHPKAIHVCVTRLHTLTDCADRFIRDLKQAIVEVSANPDKFSKGSAAIYGMAASIPDTSVVDELARSYIDTLYKA